MIAWVGTIASIVGAFLVAFGIVLSGYLAFTLGASAWVIVALLRKDKPLFILNATFLCANIVGLTRSIL